MPVVVVSIVTPASAAIIIPSVFPAFPAVITPSISVPVFFHIIPPAPSGPVTVLPLTISASSVLILIIPEQGQACVQDTLQSYAAPKRLSGTCSLLKHSLLKPNVAYSKHVCCKHILQLSGRGTGDSKTL